MAPGFVWAAGSDDVWRGLITEAVRAGMSHNLPKAEQLFLQAVREADRFPAGDPRSGTTWNSLGLIYREEKKYADAEKAFEKALTILEKAYGAASLDAGNVGFNIATTMMSGGHYEASLPYITRARSIYEKLLGNSSLKTASTWCMEGDVDVALQRYGVAEVPLKRCADMREDASGLESAELADALQSLAKVYEAQGKLNVAEPRLKMAEKIRELTNGVMSPEFAGALEAHGAMLRKMGREKEAAKDEAMAAAIRRTNPTKQ